MVGRQAQFGQESPDGGGNAVLAENHQVMKSSIPVFKAFPELPEGIVRVPIVFRHQEDRAHWERPRPVLFKSLAPPVELVTVVTVCVRFGHVLYPAAVVKLDQNPVGVVDEYTADLALGVGEGIGGAGELYTLVQ